MNRQLPVKPKHSLPLRMLNMLWRKRHPLVATVHSVGHSLAWLYDKFPLPRRVKDITTELVFQSIEHFVVQSRAYQDWLERKSGLSQLHGLFQAERPEEGISAPDAPTDSEWNALKERCAPLDETPELAVVVPVHSGYNETLNCLYHLLNCAREIPYQVTVINDASPDSALTAKLAQLHQSLPFELLVNKQNQGFVRTANRGLRRHATQHVILLNADTQVYDHWSDRMMQAMFSADDIASVTPFSNNAELCSYPRIFHSNALPQDIDAGALNTLMQHAHNGEYPTLPTAVGFCMAMRREAIQQTGRFDEKKFGKGYGEENDWCLRAAESGWRHVLSPNVFVAHIGSVSFAAAKQRQLRRSLRRLNARHPGYRAAVRDFKRNDPLKPIRRNIDLARLAKHKQAKNMLMISHRSGGGTERHVQDLTTLLSAEHTSCFRLSPGDHSSQIQLWHPECSDVPNLTFDIRHERDALIATLKHLSISQLHLHHLHGFSQHFHLLVPRLADALKCRFDVTIHDYYFACPSINLPPEIAAQGRLPTLAESQSHASQNPTPAGRTPVWVWRQQHANLLQQAAHVFVPDPSVRTAIASFFPGLNPTLRAHPELPLNAPDLFLPRSPDAPLAIAIIGSMTPHKGADVIAALAKEAVAKKVPVRFHIFGQCTHAALKKNKLVTLHGAYQHDDIYTMLQQHPCHMAFIPSVWPETWSYTLSIALNARMHPVCFDLGAPAQRLRAAKCGTILHHSLIDRPADCLRALRNISTVPANALSQSGEYPSMLRDYYASELYESTIADSSATASSETAAAS